MQKLNEVQTFKTFLNSEQDFHKNMMADELKKNKELSNKTRNDRSKVKPQFS